MLRYLFLPALVMLLQGCAVAGTQGTLPQQRLADRLPPRIGDFARQEVAAIDGSSGNLRIRYAEQAQGAWASVFVLRPPGAPLPDGAGSEAVRRDVAEAALVISLYAAAQPGTRIERGPDFSMTAQGKAVPSLRCAEFRMGTPQTPVLKREMVCSSGVEGMLVRVRATVRHNPKDMDPAHLYLSGFSGRVTELMRGAAQPTAAESGPPARPAAGTPEAPLSGPLQRL